MKEYKRLGDYIREVNVRNRDLKVTQLLGLSMTKQFRPSTSNIVGVDLSNYKIVNHNTFAFDPMSVIRVHKVPIAINNTTTPIIVSPAYYTFEVSDTSKLLPQYLMMWIMRPEFDRYADYKSDSAVRGGYDWKELCDTPICVPSIERQREIVSEYETLTRRIRLNEQMIEKLEATAQALYRKTFVDNIDKQNLPQGWHLATLGEIFDITIGRTPPRAEEKWFCGEAEKENNLPWVSIADMNNGMYILNTRERLTKEAVDRFKIPVVPPFSVLLSFKMTVGRVCITTETTLSNEAIAHFVFKDNQHICEFLYLCLKDVDYKAIGSTSSITEAINTNMIKQMQIIMPSDGEMRCFHEKVYHIFHAIKLKQQENIKLTELQSLLLARMGK